MLNLNDWVERTAADNKISAEQIRDKIQTARPQQTKKKRAEAWNKKDYRKRSETLKR